MYWPGYNVPEHHVYVLFLKFESQLRAEFKQTQGAFGNTTLELVECLPLNLTVYNCTTLYNDNATTSGRHRYRRAIPVDDEALFGPLFRQRQSSNVVETQISPSTTKATDSTLLANTTPTTNSTPSPTATAPTATILTTTTPTTTTLAATAPTTTTLTAASTTQPPTSTRQRPASTRHPTDTYVVQILIGLPVTNTENLPVVVIRAAIALSVSHLHLLCYRYCWCIRAKYYPNNIELLCLLSLPNYNNNWIIGWIICFWRCLYIIIPKWVHELI